MKPTLVAVAIILLIGGAFADFPAGRVTVSMDAAPAQRWPWASLVGGYSSTVNQALSLLDHFLPAEYQSIAEEIGSAILPYLGEFGEEIKAFSTAFNFPLGKAVLLNLIYEIEAGCTSIVAQSTTGQIFHARNLDFTLAPVLRNLTIQADFVSQSKGTSFTTTTYVGYVGALTGESKEVSVSLNQRFLGGTQWENLLQALFVPGTTTAGFLIRRVLADQNDFTTAVNRLQNTPLAAPCYIIVAGVAPGAGTVITRDRDGGALWTLAPPSTWFLVQTNDDHDKPPRDNRRAVANKLMTGIGATNFQLQSLFQVLSTPPVLATSTTYTSLMSAGVQAYNTTVRTP